MKQEAFELEKRQKRRETERALEAAKVRAAIYQQLLSPPSEQMRDFTQPSVSESFNEQVRDFTQPSLS